MYDYTCRLYCDRIDICTDKFPSITLAADNGVDTVRTGTNVKHTNILAGWYPGVNFRCQKICDVVNIVRTSWNRWTQITLGDLPIGHVIVMRQ